MIFITGGTGLVGSHLLIRLLHSGQSVKALYRPESDLHKVSALFESYGPQTSALFPRIQWVEGDLNDLPSLIQAFEEVTEVYHCAALISFKPKDRELLRQINHTGTQNIVNLCLEKAVKRLYYCSSIATIGGIKSPLTENDLWDFADSNVYATSKYLAEMEVWRGGQEGLETVIVNPGVIFGPGFWNQGSGQFFTKVASGLKYAPPGSTGFVGVWDVVRAFEVIADNQGFNQRFILVAENLKYSEVISQIADVLKVPGPKKKLKHWQLEWLWRLDWFRATLTRNPRKLSRATARNLRKPRAYSSEKVKGLTGFRFQSIGDVLRRCGEHFPQKRAGTQS
ncbi:MAG: NAD-dependent epimerase/dehydratase family protein [Robiginitalea sp.]|uniref:NAD-dependent epimerase/dehydratase family protein n=1 Tax=Robiginitalea sp. TaxID=1902411 RepID=UPI003C77D02E